MKYTLLTNNWNADPNSPNVEIFINGTSLILDFHVNYFVYEGFNEGDKARITFKKCHKYSFNTTNDEGYFYGQYRYKNKDLPWGEFYELETNWETDFPLECTILTEQEKLKRLRHYIFFFKDNTFECVAEDYELNFFKC